MKRWMVGLISLFLWFCVYASCPATVFAADADFILEVPLELRNIPVEICPLRLRIKLFDNNKQMLGLDHFAINQTSINPDGTYNYVQIVTIKNWVNISLQNLKKAASYEIQVESLKAGVGFEKEKPLMTLDPTQPVVSKVEGNIKRP